MTACNGIMEIFMTPLRQQLIHQRQKLPLFNQIQASNLIAKKAYKLPIFKKSLYIAFYQAIHGEVNCAPLLKYAEQQQKNILLPVLEGQSLRFIRYQSNQPLIKNRYGIDEPIITPENIVEAIDIDLVFVPLVAFDTKMNRLGMGKGYYDRTFHFLKKTSLKKKPTLIGLGYEFQKIETIEAKSWDIPLDQVITECCVYS